MDFPGQPYKELETLEIFSRSLELMRGCSICALATALEAKPRVRAMQYAVDPAGILYFLTEGGRKVRDILLNPNVSISMWDTTEKTPRGLTITARAEIVDQGDAHRFIEYYTKLRESMGGHAPDPGDLSPAVKLIRAVPDLIELFDPALPETGFNPRQIWRR